MDTTSSATRRRRFTRLTAAPMVLCAVLLVALSGPAAGAPGPVQPGVTVVSASRDGHVDLSTKAPLPVTVAKLDLTAGTWVVWAKLRLGLASYGFADVTCDLGPAQQRHSAITALSDGGVPYAPDDVQTMELSQLVKLPVRGGGTAVTLRCVGDDVQASRIKLMAMKIGTLTEVDLEEGTQTVSGVGKPEVVYGHRDVAKAIPGESAGFQIMATMPVPEGNWWIHATLPLATTTGDADVEVTADCFLSLNLEDIDSGATRLWSQRGRYHTAVMDLTHRLDSPGIAGILCKSDAPAGQVRVESIRITAIRVGKLTEYGFPPRSGVTTGPGTPRVIAGARTSATVIDQDVFETVATLPLKPGGYWMVVAKVRTKLPSAAFATCELVAGTASDTGTTGFLSSADVPSGTLIGRRTLALRLTAGRLGSAPQATLRCRNDYPNANYAKDYSVDWVHITALRVTHLTHDSLYN